MKNDTQRPVPRRTFVGRLAAGAIAVNVTSPIGAFAEDGRNPQRLDRTKLLVYRDENGEVQTVKNREGWLKRRAVILEGMQELMGPLPGREKRTPLDVRIVRESDDGDYVTRLISYAPEPGDRIPAWLLVPKRAMENGVRLPGVLSPLGTGMSAKAFGKPALETEGFPRWDDHRDYARELAERGLVTLVPAYPHLGEYRPDHLGTLGYQSGTMKAVWNNIRGLDLLDSLPYVRTGRYGSIGHSLGGHNSIYTAVFDERIVAVVTSCGFDSYLDYMDGDIRGWAQDRYMPRIAEYKLEEIPVDFHEMIAAIAPRACFVNAPIGDSNFKWKSAAAVVAAAKEVYNLYGVADRLRIEHPDAGHSFPDDVRLPALRFLDQYLMNSVGGGK